MSYGYPNAFEADLAERPSLGRALLTIARSAIAERLDLGSSV